MHIIEYLSRNRRDFSATLQCEGCGNKEKLTSGYDDSYYHNEVLPNMKCKKCGESTNTLEVGIRTRPQFPDAEII